MDRNELDGCRLFGDLPAAAARAWGDRPYLSFGSDGWSYAEFSQAVDRVAAALLAQGLRRGDRIAIWMANRPENEFLLFAIARIGGIVVPLNSRYRSEDARYVIRHSECRAIFQVSKSGPVDYDALLSTCLGDVEARAGGGSACSGAPDLRYIVSIGASAIPGSTQWGDFLAGGQAAGALPPMPRDVAPEDNLIIIYTSGTTGAPKGVRLNHRAVEMARDRARIMGLQPSDTQVTYLPLFHTFGITFPMLMPIFAGARQILVEEFDADRILDLVESERIAMFHGFDTHFKDFLNAQRARPRDIGSLRLGTLAVGAVSSVELARQVQAELCPTLSAYGLTEVWGAVTMSPADSTVEQRCEASGAAQAGVEMRTANPETGLLCAPGVMGEIQLRCACQLSEYYRMPDETAKAITADGWFRTGDAGIIRPDGHLRFLSRYKDILKVGGENVSPAEIESILLSVPGVAQAAVVGAPDERLHEVAVAFVVRQPGSALDEGGLVAHCKGKIASFKVPRRVIFLDSLPMTATGKVQKEKLRGQLGQMAAS